MSPKTEKSKDETKETKLVVGDIVKPLFRPSGLHQTKTHEFAGINEAMTKFILKSMDEAKPLVVIYSGKRKVKEGDVNVVRFDTDFRHLWVSTDFEKTGTADKKDRRDTKLNTLSEEQHIHISRPEVVEDLTKAVMTSVEKTMKSFGGISNSEICEACAMVMTITKAREVAGHLPNNVDIQQLLMEAVARRRASGDEEGEFSYTPSTDKSKTDHYIG